MKGKEKIDCVICEKSFDVYKYAHGVCPFCGQGHVYDNDVYRIELSGQQRKLLLEHSGAKKNELTDRLRHELNLSEADATDEDILKNTKGSFMLARIELGMALARFRKELKTAIGLKS